MEIKTSVKSSIKTLSNLNKKFKPIGKKIQLVLDNSKFCSSFFNEKNVPYYPDTLVHKLNDNSQITDSLASIIELIQNLKNQTENPDIKSDTIINEKIFNQLKTELDRHREYLNENQITKIEKISNNVLDKDTLNRLLSSLLNDLKKKNKLPTVKKSVISKSVISENNKILQNIVNSELSGKVRLVVEKLFDITELRRISQKLVNAKPQISAKENVKNISEKPHKLKRLLEFRTNIFEKIPKSLLKIYVPKFERKVIITTKTKELPTAYSKPLYIHRLIKPKTLNFLRKKILSTNKFTNFVFSRQKDNLSQEVKNIFQNHVSSTAKLVNIEKRENVFEDITKKKITKEKKINSQSIKVKKNVVDEKITDKKVKTSVKKLKKISSKQKNEEIINKKKLVKSDISKKQSSTKTTDFTETENYKTSLEKQKFLREKQEKIKTFKAIESKIISISKTQEQRILDTLTRKNITKTSNIFAKNILNKNNFEKFFVKSNLLNNYIQKNKKIIQKNLDLTKVIQNNKILEIIKKSKLAKLSKISNREIKFVFLDKFAKNYIEEDKIINKITKNKLFKQNVKNLKLEHRDEIRNINLLKSATKIKNLNKKIINDDNITKKTKILTNKIHTVRNKRNKQLSNTIFIDEKFVEKLNENQKIKNKNYVKRNNFLETNLNKLVNIDEKNLINSKKIFNDYKIENLIRRKQKGITRNLLNKTTVNSLSHIKLGTVNDNIIKEFEINNDFLISPSRNISQRVYRKILNREIPIDSTIYEPILKKEILINTAKHNRKIQKNFISERENIFKEIGQKNNRDILQNKVRNIRKFTHRNFYDDIDNKKIIEKKLITNTTKNFQAPNTKMIYKLEKEYQKQEKMENKKKTSKQENRDSTKNQQKPLKQVTHDDRKKSQKRSPERKEKIPTIDEITDLIDEKLDSLNLGGLADRIMVKFENKILMDRRRVGMI